MGQLEKLDSEVVRYRGFDYKIKVFYSPPKMYPRYPARVVKVRKLNSSIERYSHTERLDPSSIIPWRDPEPMSKEAQVAHVKEVQNERIDAFCERKQKADQ